MKYRYYERYIMLFLIAQIKFHEISSNVQIIDEDQEMDIDSLCSRDLSRLVRKIAEKTIFKHLPSSINTNSPRSKSNANILPSNCPFHPSNDLYLDQELHKRETGNREWKCDYCGKIFRSEYYLDVHMSRKHMDKLNNGTSMCLGDLCTILGCNIQPKNTAEAINRGLSIHKWSSRQFSSSSKQPYSKPELCTKTTVDKYKFQCQTLMKSCFDNIKAENGQILSEMLQSTICNQLKCKNGILIGKSVWEDDLKDSPKLISWLLQLVLVVMIIIFVFGYLLFADVNWFNIFGNKNASEIMKKNQLALKKVIKITTANSKLS